VADWREREVDNETLARAINEIFNRVDRYRQIEHFKSLLAEEQGQ